MIILVMNKNFEVISYYEDYESLLWTDRYNEYGDFELYIPYSTDNLEILQIGYYLWSNESDHIMIIESINMETDVESGNHVTVTGRSLESILDRRIVWSQTNIDTTLQNGIKQLLNDAIISPSNTKRKISNFVFEESSDTAITSLKLEAQFTGDNLYDVISSVCSTNKIGFKIILNESLQFVFKLYAGVDRSYNQTENLFVVFSEGFDNVITSNYLESEKTLKNVTLVGGEGEGTDRKTYAVYVNDKESEGLVRRETFTDARDISTKTEENTTISDGDYNQMLKERGLEKLNENKTTKSFEGEYETTGIYKYEQDFFVGDVVQIVTEYGKEERVRITEMIRSINKNGYATYPTFISEEDKEETQ